MWPQKTDERGFQKAEKLPYSGPHPLSSSQMTRQGWVCRIALTRHRSNHPFLLPVKLCPTRAPGIPLGSALCLLQARPCRSVCLRQGALLVLQWCSFDPRQWYDDAKGIVRYKSPWKRASSSLQTL